MKHFRIKAKKEYLYYNYRYYPQYKKNILCPYRYLRKEDIVGLELCALDNLFNWYRNVDSDGRVFADSFKDAKTICELYKRFLKDCQDTFSIYTYLDI